MQVSMNQLIDMLPSYIQKNKKVLSNLVEELDKFLKAPGTILKQEVSHGICLMKNNFKYNHPFQNTSFYYLEIDVLSESQTEIYIGTTKKELDESKYRMSFMEPIKYHCYLNGDSNLHVEKQEQKIIDKESSSYHGILFRTIQAKRSNELYGQNQELLKREFYYGTYDLEHPFLHQAIEESYTTKSSFEIEIECPFYTFVNVLENFVYMKTLFSKTEMEKYYMTNQNNVNESLEVINENELIPIQKKDWERAIGSIMKYS